MYQSTIRIVKPNPTRVRVFCVYCQVKTNEKNLHKWKEMIYCLYIITYHTTYVTLYYYQPWLWNSPHILWLRWEVYRDIRQGRPKQRTSSDVTVKKRNSKSVCYTSRKLWISHLLESVGQPTAIRDPHSLLVQNGLAHLTGVYFLTLTTLCTTSSK